MQLWMVSLNKPKRNYPTPLIFWKYIQNSIYVLMGVAHN